MSPGQVKDLCVTDDYGDNPLAISSTGVLRNLGLLPQALYSYAKILLSLAFHFAKGMSLGNCVCSCPLASSLLNPFLPEKSLVELWVPSLFPQ